MLTYVDYSLCLFIAYIALYFQTKDATIGSKDVIVMRSFDL